MSNNIPNEDALWDTISGKTPAEPVAESQPEPKAEPQSEPQSESKAAPAPVVKEGRKLDKFFITCMACVAAVSVAVTALACNLIGGNSPAQGGSDSSAVVEELKQENAELRAQLQLQTEQVKKLQKDLLTLMGTEEYLSTMPTDSEGNSQELTDQLAALELLAQVQEAYTNYDSDALAELIPQMDTMLSYLPAEALNDYYMILEYVEMPSNG